MAYFGNQPIQSTYLTDYFSGNGSTTAFTLTRAPIAASSIIVTISGVKQAASTYGVAGTTLTFSEAPPTGTNNIEVLHLGIAPETVTLPSYRTITEFTATAGQTTFSPASYTVGYIDVYRNGVKLGAADFTATNGTTVVLANACTAGDYVRFEGFLITSFNNAIPNTAGAVGSSLLAAGAAATNIGAGGVTQSMLANNVAGTGPVFRVYLGTAQNVTSAVATKVAFDTVDFDTASCWDNVNYRFTPNVAGYYEFHTNVYLRTATAGTYGQTYITKNGSESIGYSLARYTSGSSSGYGILTCSGLVYMNGSTDYAEVFALITATTPFFEAGLSYTKFSGALVRAA